MKKICILLVLILTLTLTATLAGCSLKSELTDLKNNESNKQLRFVLSADKDYYAVKAKEYITSAKIPDTYNGKPVKEILPSGFANMDMTSVTLGSNIEKIGEFAFAGNSLSSITLPDSVEEIGNHAFNGNNSLYTIFFNDGVKIVKDYAFEGCSYLTNIYIDSISAWVKTSFTGSHSNPMEMNSYAKFYFGNSSTGVRPSDITTLDNSALEGLTTIGANAFKGWSITSITLPSTITEVGYDAFANCNILTVNAPSVIDFAKINFSNSSANPLANGADLYVDGQKVTALTQDNFSSATKIGAYAFANYNDLISVDLPQTLTEIGENAFMGCTNLSTVNAHDLTSYLNIKFGREQSTPIIGATTFTIGGEPLTEVDIPDGVTKIPAYAFYDRGEITSVDLTGVTHIGEGAFYNVEADIVIPTTVEFIGAGAFTKSDYDLIDGSCTVIFYSQNSFYDSQIVTKTVGLSYPTPPTRTGYLFGGWYDNAECTGSPYDFSENITKPLLNLYAKWVSTNGESTLSVGSTTVYAYGKSSGSNTDYMFVPSVTGTYSIYTSYSSGTDTYCYLKDANKELLAENDDAGGYNNFKIERVLTAGTVYYIRPCFYSKSGNLTVYITAPTQSSSGVCTTKLVNLSSTSNITFEGEGNWTLTQEIIPPETTKEDDALIPITSSTTEQDIVTYFVHSYKYFAWRKN